MSASDHSQHLPPAANSNGHPEQDRPRRGTGFWRSKAGLAAIGFLLIAAFFLPSEHRAHALGLLPFLLFLACPLLHLFMHRDHGGHREHDSTPTTGQHTHTLSWNEHRTSIFAQWDRAARAKGCGTRKGRKPLVSVGSSPQA